MKNKKELWVEICRILACFLVIAYHTKSDAIALDGSIKKDVLLLWSMCTPCVVSFFLISGFYMYDRPGKILDIWLKNIKNFIFKILFPACAIAIFCLIFELYFYNKATIIACIKNINLSFIIGRFLYGLIHFDVTKWTIFTSHLWYVFSYAWIIICYPITRFVLNLNKKYRNLIIGFFVLLILLNDITVLFDNWTLALFFCVMQKPVIYSACGYILYHDIIPKIKKLDIKNTVLLSLFLYIISLIYVYLMQYKFFLIFGANHNYVYGSWHSIFSIVMTSGIFIFIYKITTNFKIKEKLSRIICHISDTTFGIFIIHYPIVAWLISRGIEDKAMRIFKYNTFTQVLYVIIYNAVIFIISYILVVIYKKLKNLCWRKI